MTGLPFCLIMFHFDSVMFGERVIVADVTIQSASLCLSNGGQRTKVRQR